MANRTSAKRLEMVARLEREIDLRRMGFSYSQIATEVGVNKSTVCRDVMRELKRLAHINDGKTLEHRELELHKLDALEREMQRVMTRHHCLLYKGGIVNGIDPKTGARYELIDDGPVIAAARELRSISERRCRLLGLDLPQRLEHTGGGGGPIQHEYDFSALTDEQLEEEIVREAERITGREVGEGESD